jgi:hypothetical protein
MRPTEPADLWATPFVPETALPGAQLESILRVELAAAATRLGLVRMKRFARDRDWGAVVGSAGGLGDPGRDGTNGLRLDGLRSLMRVENGEAHVWLVSLEAPAARRAQLERTLSRMSASGRRVTGRPLPGSGSSSRAETLRELLGAYCGLVPERVRFSYALHVRAGGREPSQRKPRLDPEELRFNVSHHGRPRRDRGDARRRRRDRHRAGAVRHRRRGDCGADPRPHPARAAGAERPGVFYREWTRQGGSRQGARRRVAPDGDGTRWWVSEVACQTVTRPRSRSRAGSARCGPLVARGVTENRSP